MSDDKRLEIAKQYVDQQLATMKQHGSAPAEISKEEYNALVQEVAETVRT
jgi:hypothetical protein